MKKIALFALILLLCSFQAKNKGIKYYRVRWDVMQLINKTGGMVVTFFLYKDSLITKDYGAAIKKITVNKVAGAAENRVELNKHFDSIYIKK